MKPQELPKSAQSVQEALIKKGLNFKIIELPTSAHTANAAAESLGCMVAQIIKSLIFKTKNTHLPILVLASGINRVNEKTIESELGEQIQKADADFTRDVTGFAIGGIPPIGHKQAITTFIDKDLLQYDELWAAAGTPNTVFSLNSKDIAIISNGKIISIK